MQKAQAELVQAKQSYDRAEELDRRQLVSKQTVEDASATLQSKQAGYESALQNARNLRADIDASEAAMKLAERQLRDTTIRAPFDGYVEKRLVNTGEYVKVQTPVMSVVRVDPLKVTAEIPEKLAPWISGRPAGGAARGRVPRQGHRRQGVAHQPGGQHGDAGVSRSRRWCPTATGCSSPARSRACASSAARSTRS